MADTKITALTAITTVDPAVDVFPIVDVSDTTMAASGTTKKITSNQILGAGGTATLASATITGAATVGTTLGVTGVSTFAAGTAALPALTTTGDTNTGIFYPAADTFGVTTGGSERLRIDSSGNVGVGASPVGRLNIANTGADVVTSMTAVGVQRWQFIVNNSTAAFSIYDQTNTRTAVSIDSLGNIVSNITGTAPSLGSNGQLVVNATSNTNLRFSYRGSDGVTRVANLTLA
jgi:hypothetical protein